MANKLTDKQRNFCYEYINNGGNATQAYKDAGYKYSTDEVARVSAGRLLTKAYIDEFISKNRKEAAKRQEITMDMITAEFAKMAFSSMAHLHNTWIDLKKFEEIPEDHKACIQEINTKIEDRYDHETNKSYQVKYIKLKLYDKQRALENLAKHVGYYEADNKQKPGFNVIDLSKDQIKKISDNLEDEF